MILSNRHRFLYVNIAKTGGTSVRAALKSLQWRDPYYLAQWVCSRLSGLTGHRIAAKLPRHAKIICAQEMLPKDFFDGLYKFAFVRNPWDLQVSSYHHLKRERPHLLEGRETFEAFTRWKLDPQRPYQYHLDTSITPLTDYLIDLRGNLLTDFIGRYERLHEDWDQVCKRLGIPTPELPHKRQATDRSKDYRSYYSDDLAQLVGDYFRRDVELLGYRFDPE
jgi:hypothetical protein